MKALGSESTISRDLVLYLDIACAPRWGEYLYEALFAKPINKALFFL